MIDKADFRVPWNVPLTRDFEAMIKHADSPTATGEGQGVWSQSTTYQRRGDFRQFGLDVIFHERCTRTKVPNHKIEILETGSKTLREMRDITREMFHCDEMELAIMRTDLTADIEGVPVQWFRDHTLVRQKRTTREIGTIPGQAYMTVGKGIAETLYSGVKPNQIRIYDKTGERLEKLHRHNLSVSAQNKKNFMESPHAVAVMPSTFDQMFGYPATKKITRVENQIHGKSLERIGLVKMGDLQRAHEVEPFTKIQFINDREIPLIKSDWTFEEWHTGLFFMEEARSHGIAAAKRMMYREVGNKHFYERWGRYMPFIQNGDRACTYQKLQDEYVASCHAQLYVA